jgi:hypothetical protein
MIERFAVCEELERIARFFAAFKDRAAKNAPKFQNKFTFE